MTTPNGRAQVKAVFGNPALRNGSLNKHWEATNIIDVTLPYKMFYGGKPVTHISFHKLAAPQLKAALEDIWNYARHAVKEQYGYDHSTAYYDKKTREYLSARGLTNFGGSYVFRHIEGSTNLSTHAFGIAIDIDPEHNAQGTKGHIPPFAAAIFKKHGFFWGGDWRLPRKDPMHMQLATGV
jgi:hypothetical protein